MVSMVSDFFETEGHSILNWSSVQFVWCDRIRFSKGSLCSWSVELANFSFDGSFFSTLSLPRFCFSSNIKQNFVFHFNLISRFLKILNFSSLREVQWQVLWLEPFQMLSKVSFSWMLWVRYSLSLSLFDLDFYDCDHEMIVKWMLHWVNYNMMNDNLIVVLLWRSFCINKTCCYSTARSIFNKEKSHRKETQNLSESWCLCKKTHGQ